MVRSPLNDCSLRAESTTRRRSATPAETALRATYFAPISFAMMPARIFLPLPGGPQRIMEGSWSRSMLRRSTVPLPTMWSWPTSSSNERGRIRAASGSKPVASCGGVGRSDCVPSPRALATAQRNFLLESQRVNVLVDDVCRRHLDEPVEYRHGQRKVPELSDYRQIADDVYRREDEDQQHDDRSALPDRHALVAEQGKPQAEQCRQPYDRLHSARPLYLAF